MRCTAGVSEEPEGKGEAAAVAEAIAAQALPLTMNPLVQAEHPPEESHASQLAAVSLPEQQRPPTQ